MSMRIVQIKDVLALGHDEVIPAIRGRITEIYKRNAGTNSKGEWSMQNLKIKDDTGEVKVVVRDREELPQSLKGKLVFIFSKQGDKGITGLKAKDDEYKGNVTRIVSVTPTATIEESDGAPAQPAQAPAKQASGFTRPPSPAPAPAPARTAAPSDNDGPPLDSYDAQTEAPPADKPNTPAHVPAVNHGKTGECKRALNKIANLYLYAIQAGHYVRSEHDAKHEKKMTDEQFQASVSSIFIQSTRDGWHHQLPIGKVE